MNDNYYQIDVCFNFESDSDEKAIDYFLKQWLLQIFHLKMRN